MASARDARRTLAEIIDEIEALRERLLCIQRELEKLERTNVPKPSQTPSA
jgi:hypothetical protein